MRVGLVQALRQVDWLDQRRAKAYRNILLGVSLVDLLAWVGLSHDGVDPTGKVLGTDFLSFYAASRLVLAGDPAGVYRMAIHRAAEISVFGHDFGYAAFFYPPLFLLICAPLTLLPYFTALLVWLGATGAAFVATLSRWFDKRFGWSTVAAFPGVLLNIGHGQNAFLSTALLGSGAYWLENRPILAGVAFGLLAFKPHLGLLIPLALVCRGRWKTTVVAGVTVMVFVGVSVAAFGPATWRAFLASSASARATLELGLVDPGKMVSAFAAVRVVGGSGALAWAVQGVVTLAVGAAMVVGVRRTSSVRAEGALIVLACLLGTPFLLDYDLTILAIPLAWLAGEGLRSGFRPWEKIALLLAFVLPVVARGLAMAIHLPVAPAVLLFLFAVSLQRALGPTSRAPRSPWIGEAEPV
jgi:hypothetical protein